MPLTNTGALVVAGAHAARTRWGLVVLLWGAGGLLSLLGAALVVRPLQVLAGASGFAEALAQGTDLALWADLLKASRPALQAAAIHLLWILPVSMAWKAAASVGLLHAVQRSRGGFWQGARRYLPASLLLGALFLACAVAIGLAAAAIVLAVGSLWHGVVVTFWVRLVLGPLVVGAAVAWATVARDAARAAMVAGGCTLWAAILAGLRMPLRRRAIWGPFAACCAAGTTLAATSFLLESLIVGISAPKVLGLFVVQQLLHLLIAALIVGWYGSLAAYAQALPDSALHRITDGDGTVPEAASAVTVP